MDYDLLMMLDKAREEAGVPFHINSAYRCPKHNAKVGGVKDSSHLYGMAVDISTMTSRARFRVLQAVLKMGAQRVGVANTFIHVDVDDDKPLNVAWTY